MDILESPGFLVNKLAHAMAVDLDRQLQAHGVTTSQWAILALLWHREGRSQVELQELLGVEAATITGLARRMEQLGLVRREADPRDKRVQRVSLTARSRALEGVLVPVADAVNARALGGFSSDERHFFVRLLLRALHNYDGG